MKMTIEQENILQLIIQFVVDKDEKYMIIQGDSGTGKTSLIGMMKHYIDKNFKMYQLLQVNRHLKSYNFIYSATTNKAARVLENHLGQSCTTIHSILGLRVQNDYKTGKTSLVPTKNSHLSVGGNTPTLSFSASHLDILIIDEASFIGDELFEYIEKYTPYCKIILIGDAYQLAPIKQSNTVMEDFNCKYNCQLKKIIRNNGLISALGQQCKKIVEHGDFSPLSFDNKQIIYADGVEFQKQVNLVFTNNTAPSYNAKILAWTNQKVIEYNNYIRTLKGYSKHFVENERAICNQFISVNKYVCTADREIIITKISLPYILHGVSVVNVNLDNHAFSIVLPLDLKAKKAVLEQFKRNKDWHTFFEIKDGWLDIRPIYASTVHKSQGSEYDNVFIDLNDIGKCKNPKDLARMLYVAITRAKQKVYLYGKLPKSYGGKPVMV